MRNALKLATALIVMAGFSAFAQDGATPGQTPAPSEAPAAPGTPAAPAKKESKKAKRSHHKKEKKAQENK